MNKNSDEFDNKNLEWGRFHLERGLTILDKGVYNSFKRLGLKS